MIRYNYSENELISLFKLEPLDIWINSFGGCRSNFIRDLIKDKYKTYNAAYEYKACHYIRPLDVQVGCGVFCYIEDVGIALTSQLSRNMTHNFTKLIDDDSPFSVEIWLNKINQQIDNWTKKTYFPIILINTDKVLEYKNEFKHVFGVELEGFKSRNTKEYHSSLLPYKGLINDINNKLQNLPNFDIIK